jgi:hypothetical protein
MKNEKGGGKQSGRKRSARKHRKSSSTPPRKRQANRSQTLAAKSGLQGRDLVMTAPQESARSIHLIDRPPLDILDLPFSLWSAVLKLSPLPHILRQQAVLTRLWFEVWLPERSAPEKRGLPRRRNSAQG